MRQVAARTIQNNQNRNKQSTPRTVGDLVTKRRCMTFHPGEYVEIILPLLQSHETGVAGVLDDEGGLVGLLTEREILRRIFARIHDPVISPANLRKHLEDMTVEEVMIAAPRTLDEATDFEEAAGMMLLHNLRFMPVVSRADREHLLGIVSEREVAEALRTRLLEIKQSEAESRSLLSFMLHEPYGLGYSMTGMAAMTPQSEPSA
jgi:CBS domain-containing protein